MDIIHGVIKDMLEVDSKMSMSELYDHCKIIGKHNGLTETQIRQSFQSNEQLKERKL